MVFWMGLHWSGGIDGRCDSGCVSWAYEPHWSCRSTRDTTNAAHAGSITWNTYNRTITTSGTPNSHIMNPGTIRLGVHRTNAHWSGYSEGRAEERMSQVLLSCFRGSCRYLAENVGGWRGGYPMARKQDQDADDAFPSIERSIFSNEFSAPFTRRQK